MSKDHAPIQIEEAYRMVEESLPSDDQLFPLLKGLMQVSDPEGVPPVYLAHYRQAAAATATLIAIKNSQRPIAFDAVKFVAGTPAMPFRIVFARRIAALHNVDLGLEVA